MGVFSWIQRHLPKSISNIFSSDTSADLDDALENSARLEMLGIFDKNAVMCQDDLDAKFSGGGGPEAIAQQISDYVFSGDLSDDYDHSDADNLQLNQAPGRNGYDCNEHAGTLRNDPNSDFDEDVGVSLANKFTSSSVNKIDKLKWLGGMLSIKSDDANHNFVNILNQFKLRVNDAVNDLMVTFGDDKNANIKLYKKAMSSLEELSIRTTKYNSIGNAATEFRKSSELDKVMLELSTTAFALFNNLVMAKKSFMNADAESQKLNSLASITRSPDDFKLSPAAQAAKEAKKAAKLANDGKAPLTPTERKAKILEYRGDCAALRSRQYKEIDETGKTYRVTDFKNENYFLAPDKYIQSLDLNRTHLDSIYSMCTDLYSKLAEYTDMANNTEDNYARERYKTMASNLKKYLEDYEEYCYCKFQLSQLLLEDNKSTFSQERKDAAEFFKVVQGDDNQTENENKFGEKNGELGYTAISPNYKKEIPIEAVNYFRDHKTMEMFKFTDHNNPQEEMENDAPLYDDKGNITGTTARLKLRGGKATEEEYKSLWKYTGYSATINALAAGYKGGSFTGEFLGNDIDFDADQRKTITNNGAEEASNDAQDLRNLTSLIGKSTYDKDVWLQSAQSFIGLQSFLGMGTEDDTLEIMRNKIEFDDYNEYQNGKITRRDNDKESRSYSDMTSSKEFLEANQKMRKYIGYMNEMPQFMSTTIYKGGGGNFNLSAQVKLNIYAPKGSEMLYVADLGFYGGNEQEVILQRGGMYSIEDIYWSFDETFTKSDPVLFVDMRLHPEHGYNKRQQEPKKK